MFRCIALPFCSVLSSFREVGSLADVLVVICIQHDDPSPRVSSGSSLAGKPSEAGASLHRKLDDRKKKITAPVCGLERPSHTVWQGGKKRSSALPKVERGSTCGMLVGC